MTKAALTQLKRRLYIIIFEADTPLGKLFDVVLLLLIALSIIVVMAESIPSVRSQHQNLLEVIEWTFTALFTIEYLLRIYVSRKPLGYIFSFYGIIDLVSLLPTFLTFLLVGSHSLMVVRALRLLRVFRILKFTRYTHEGRELMLAIIASRYKIFVFLFAVLNMVVIMGTLMYMVEGEKNGFTSIPHSIYWAIVTVTTVGYGDISPHTDFGKVIASISMILGYAILAVPTGIVTSEISKRSLQNTTSRVCPDCFVEGHDEDARFCKNCGYKLWE